MSGYDSIKDWAYDNFDPNDFDSFQDWLDVIENDFDENGRGIPLRDIFDIADFERLEQFYNDIKGKTREEEPYTEDIIPDITTSPIMDDITTPHIVEDIITNLIKPTDIIEPIKFASKFGGFLRKLFKI